MIEKVQNNGWQSIIVEGNNEEEQAGEEQIREEQEMPSMTSDPITHSGVDCLIQYMEGRFNVMELSYQVRFDSMESSHKARFNAIESTPTMNKVIDTCKDKL